MNDSLIPYRYAKALYKLTVEKGNSKEMYEEMKRLSESFRRNPGLDKVLSNPFVSRSDKESILLKAAGDDADPDYSAFIRLVLDHHRDEYFCLMALAFQRIYREEHKISSVDIRTASNLDNDQIEKIKSIVRNSFPERSFEFTTSVDPDIIGGFVVDVDSVRMDASVSNEIEQLRQKLLSGN